MTRFATAVILLALALCAVEIALRGIRLRDRLEQSSVSVEQARITAPHAACYLDVLPMLDLELAVGAAQRVRLKTNEYGLRGATVPVPKPRGVYRILCLGGEEIFGSGVEEEQTVTRQLEAFLSRHTQLKVEVLNGGCPGAGPLVHLLRLRHHLLTLQPDLVVLCVNPESLVLDQNARGALRLDEAGGAAFAVHPTLAGRGSDLLDGICEEFVTAERAVRMAGEFMGLGSKSSRNGEVRRQAEARIDVSPLVEMHRLVSATYGALAVSIAPSVWSVNPQAGERDGEGFERELRGGLAQAELQDRVPVADGTEAFHHAGDVRGLFSPHSGGLSAEGSLLYAQSLARLIVTTVPGIWRQEP